MYTAHHEALLTAIRTAALQKHLLPLAQLPHPHPHPRTPFEVYQYEERVEVGQVEGRVREEIVRELNRQLADSERGRLQMELFGLEEAIEIEDNEIAMLKLQIEAERSNAKIAQIEQMNRLPQKSAIDWPTVIAQPVLEESHENEQDLKDNSRLAIYPCFRVDFDPPKRHVELDPPRKHVPHLGLTAPIEEHHKSHRQLLATYTKRSLGSSQDHTKHHHPQPEDLHKTAKDPKINTLKQEPSLVGLERQIAFLERAWEKARSAGQARQCKRYKRELMALIGHFWQTTK